MNKEMIRVGDIVNVSFNNSQYTLCSKAEVLSVPFNENDFWIFKVVLDFYTEKQIQIHYTNERLTITKTYRESENEK